MGKSYVHAHTRHHPPVRAPLGFAAEPADEEDWQRRRRRLQTSREPSVTPRRRKSNYTIEERRIYSVKQRHLRFKAALAKLNAQEAKFAY